MSVSCTRTDIPIVPGHRRGSRYIPWSTRKAKGLASHLLSWRRVRGDLDWLASAGHRRGHPMRRREFIAATAALLVSPRNRKLAGLQAVQTLAGTSVHTGHV